MTVVRLFFSSVRFPQIPQKFEQEVEDGDDVWKCREGCTFQGGEGDDEMKIMMTFMMIMRMLYKRCL